MYRIIKSLGHDGDDDGKISHAPETTAYGWAAKRTADSYNEKRNKGTVEY